MFVLFSIIFVIELTVPSNVDDYLVDFFNKTFEVFCDHSRAGKRTISSCVLPGSHNQSVWAVIKNSTFT